MPFPSLIPSSRSYTPGAVEASVSQSLAGITTTIETETRLSGGQLDLGFTAIPLADALAIRDHLSEVGRFTPFTLPSAAWSGTTDPTPARYGWIYRDAVQGREYPSPGAVCATVVDVSVSLEMVPLVGPVAPGGELKTRSRFEIVASPIAFGGGFVTTNTFSGGLASGSPVVPQVFVTVNVFTGGFASGSFPPGTAPGGSFTTTGTFTGGQASGSVLTILDLNPTFYWNPSDASTVTLSGSEIQSISDQGSTGWTLSKSSTGPQIYTDGNGKKWIDFGTTSHSNYLRNTSTTTTSLAEIYIIVDGDHGSTFPNYNGLITTTVDDNNSNEWFVTGTLATAGFDASGFFNRAYINGSTTDSLANVLPATNSPSLLRIKRSDDTAATLNNGLQLGMDRDNGGRGWLGRIGAVVGFSATLSTSQRDALQSILATDWVITLV